MLAGVQEHAWGGFKAVLPLPEPAQRWFGVPRPAHAHLLLRCLPDLQDQFETNVFYFWELYEGNVSMGRHNTSPEVQAFMENVQELLERPVGMALYEWRDGKIGNACVQGGPRGEGGLDDATGATGAAGGASYKQTSNTVDLSELGKGCMAGAMVCWTAGGLTLRGLRTLSGQIPV